MGFPEQLKKARLNIGYTQQQVADAMGISNSTYCGYETGKREPDVIKLKKLATILHTSGDALLETGHDSNEGKQNSPPSVLTEDERCLVDNYRRLDYKEKAFIQQCCEYVLNATKRKSLSSTANTEQAK